MDQIEDLCSFKQKKQPRRLKMSAFDFVSHEAFPEDQYIAEAVALCFDKKYRVTYVRKKMKNGGRFWSEISAAVTKHGEKKYLKAFAQDSNFLEEDIKAFLENREWERKGGQVETKSDQIPF
jgi:hypothetical protein